MTHVTRRAALGLVAAALATRPASAGVLHAGSGAGGLRLSGVTVDASRLARLGSPASADAVAQDLAVELRAVFRDLLAPGDAGGAMLTARVASLTLVPYSGGRAYGGRTGSGFGNDSLDGAGLLTRAGRLEAQTPILAVLDPSYSGAWYLPDIDRRRIRSISHHFAWWLRREMGV